MMGRSIAITVLACAGALVLGGGGVATAAPRPPAAFAKCSACHAAAPGAPPGVGPDLYGVFGAKAGARSGYAYSAALKASGVVWNRATLSAWLMDAQKVAPGTTMPNQSLTASERAGIIGYLAALR